jgi:hypothetical protein
LPSLMPPSGYCHGCRRPKRQAFAAAGVLELQKQRSRYRRWRGVVDRVAAVARQWGNKHYRCAMPHCALSARWVTIRRAG